VLRAKIMRNKSGEETRGRGRDPPFLGNEHRELVVLFEDREEFFRFCSEGQTRI